MTLEELRDWHLKVRDQYTTLARQDEANALDGFVNNRRRAEFKLKAQQAMSTAQMHQDAADILSEAIIQRR